MNKVPKDVVINELHEDNIWDDMDEWLDPYWEEYWDEVTVGEMSWQWYMEVSIRYREDWRYVIVSDTHKNITVENWIKENYLNCTFRYERNHFLIKEHDIATMVALKWT